MSGHQCSSGRWFTQRVDRRVILKASAALAAMAAAPVMTRSLATEAQEAPETRSNYYSEALSGDNFTVASDERFFVADFPFFAVAPHWAAEAPAAAYVVIELGFDGVSWEAPITVHVSEDGREGDRDGRYFGRLVSAGGHQYVRYQTFDVNGDPLQLPDLVFTYIDASDGPSTTELFTLAAETNAAEPPPIISRAGWGANEKLRYEDQDSSKDIIWPTEYSTVEHAIIHHSVTPNFREPMAEVRQIYYYHAITRGWGDIGYNYLVDYMGNVYEGRIGGENVEAGHAFQYNEGSAGICAIGDFTDVDVTAEAQTGLIWITSWAVRMLAPLGSAFFIDQEDVPTICSHRDVLEGDTECPGDVLWSDLPFIRQAVNDVINEGEDPGNRGYRDGTRVSITTEGANMRSGAGTSFSVIATLAAGTEGTVMDGPARMDGYNWYRIRTSSRTGWVASTLLERAAKPGGEFDEGDRVQVDTDELSLRSRAGLSGGVIATMPNGTRLTVTYAYNRVDGFEWYKVTGSYGDGWVAGEYLKTATTSKPPGEFSKGDNVQVDTDVLSLRSSAGLDSSVIATMPQDTRLRITYAYNRVGGMEWYKVTGDYGDGWCAGQYLRTASKPRGEFSEGDLVEVATDVLSLRSRAGLSGSVIASMPQGTDLTITYAYNQVDGMEWYKVTGSYGDGWCAGQYLGPRTGGDPNQIRINYTVYVSDGPVNMRSSPNTNSTIVRSLPQNAKLQVTDGPETGNGYTWWKLRSNQWGTGWVAEDFIERR